jgi:hypothetical protein
MKMTKSDFKGMIKECIRELIKEGAFNDAYIMSESARAASTTNRTASNDMVSQKNPVDVARARAAAARMAGYDDMGLGASENANVPTSSAPINQNMKKLVEAASTQMSKGDSKMANAYAAILADTAMHTLPQQMAQDPSRNGGYGAMAAAGMQSEQEKVNPEQLQAIAPAGDLGHWAKLAFGKHNK